MSHEKVKVGPGRVVGVDVVVVDKDEDGSFSWLPWGREIEKGRAPSRLGDIVLVEKDTNLGKLQGKVRWEDLEEGGRLGKVWIQSLTSPEVWVQAKPDSQGAYEVEVPEGKYRVEAGYWRKKSEEEEVEVKSGGRGWVRELFFAKPPVKKVPFSEIAELRDGEIQRLLREVYQQDLVIALKGASSGVKEKILVD